MIDKYIVASLQ